MKVFWYYMLTLLIVAAGCYGLGYASGTIKTEEIYSNAEIISINLQRSLEGCEVVAKQCLDDVNEAEHYFKVCYAKLKECAGE